MLVLLESLVADPKPPALSRHNRYKLTRFTFSKRQLAAGMQNSWHVAPAALSPMKLLRLTLDRPAENLALDEALVETADNSQTHDEVLRLWEPKQNSVVIGRSTPLHAEVDVAWCQENGIPMYRRVSGGASIVTGPGCLMYAVLLDLRQRPHLRMLDQAHRFVMQTMATALQSIGIASEIKGTCDLTIDWSKSLGQ